MPCTTGMRAGQTKLMREMQVKAAVERLRLALGSGAATVKIGPQGAVAFVGQWERDDVTDVCAYRQLQTSPELKRAVAKAEALAGRKVDERQVIAGVHSHDGGKTWGRH